MTMAAEALKLLASDSIALVSSSETLMKDGASNNNEVPNLLIKETDTQ